MDSDGLQTFMAPKLRENSTVHTKKKSQTQRSFERFLTINILAWLNSELC